MRRDLQLLVEHVGPRALLVLVGACAVVGAVACAAIEAVHQYGLPLSPKGTPSA